MEEIRRTKIKEAMKETLNVYEKLDLNMTEIEIVSRSQNVAAKVNKNNENSNVVEIVYMTTQPKTDLPTHVTVRSTGRPSTVLRKRKGGA